MKKLHDPAGGRKSDDGQLRCRCFQQGIGHAFVARRQHEEIRAREQRIGRFNVAGKAHRRIQTERAAEFLQSIFFRAGSGNGQSCGRKAVADEKERAKQQIKPFFMRKPADGQDVGPGPAQRTGWARPVEIPSMSTGLGSTVISSG
jgi:hypothetical protein